MSNENLKLSPIVWGHWRLAEWNLSPKELLELSQKCIDIGIDTIDSADIYGNYSCEKLFGDTLALNPSVRKNIKIITKCGIKLLSDKNPDVYVKHYDYSAKHIIGSVENSLKNFRTDYIDMLLLHRPSPLLNPEEVAMAFSKLKESGKVLHFGVSNFLPHQVDMLREFTSIPIEVNQVEISPLQLEHLQNGNLDHMIKNHIVPMAWSPLGGGRLFKPKNEHEKDIYETILKIAKNHSALPDQIIISWLTSHPSKIVPIVGSGKFERISNAMKAANIKLSLQEWFEIYSAALNNEVP
jgi:predicted oxidoreductase